MGALSRFDLSSDFTIFFLAMSIVLVVVSFALARATKDGRRKERGRSAHKVDDRIIDRNRELID